jgi:Ca-activated chloride channel family protein
MVYPPRELRDVPRAPIEMVFVIDCSGSMSGEPLRQAKAAIVHALKGLRPEDTFQIIRFSNQASALGAAPLAATRDNVRRAIRHVDSLNGSGGTMMVEGLKAALDFPSDGERPRYVTFLTDGYIGNERDILRALHGHLGGARVFSFGVGSAPNRYLMNRMAKIGRGAVAYLALHDDARSVMDAYQSRISHPALGDVRVDWGGLGASDVYPSDAPDLFVGRPIILTGRFTGTGRQTVTVRGTLAGRTIAMPVTIDTEDTLARHDALPAIWARTHIAELVDRSARDEATDLVGEITRLALRHNLMSPFTSFVAVDPRTRTTDGHGTTVPVGVPVPDGVRYETAVGGE